MMKAPIIHAIFTCALILLTLFTPSLFGCVLGAFAIIILGWLWPMFTSASDIILRKEKKSRRLTIIVLISLFFVSLSAIIIQLVRSAHPESEAVWDFLGPSPVSVINGQISAGATCAVLSVIPILVTRLSFKMINKPKSSKRRLRTVGVSRAAYLTIYWFFRLLLILTFMSPQLISLPMFLLSLSIEFNNIFRIIPMNMRLIISALKLYLGVILELNLLAQMEFMRNLRFLYYLGYTNTFSRSGGWTLYLSYAATGALFVLSSFFSELLDDSRLFLSANKLDNKNIHSMDRSTSQNVISISGLPLEKGKLGENTNSQLPLKSSHPLPSIDPNGEAYPSDYSSIEEVLETIGSSVIEVPKVSRHIISFGLNTCLIVIPALSYCTVFSVLPLCIQFFPCLISNKSFDRKTAGSSARLIVPIIILVFLAQSILLYASFIVLKFVYPDYFDISKDSYNPNGNLPTPKWLAVVGITPFERSGLQLFIILTVSSLLSVFRNTFLMHRSATTVPHPQHRITEEVNGKQMSQRTLGTGSTSSLIDDKGKSRRRRKRIALIKSLLRISASVALSKTSWLALFVLYVVALSHVDLVHGVFVVLLAIFIPRRDRKKIWRILLVVTTLLFFFLLIMHIIALGEGPTFSQRIPPWVLAPQFLLDSPGLWNSAMPGTAAVTVLICLQQFFYCADSQSISIVTPSNRARAPWAVAPLIPGTSGPGGSRTTSQFSSHNPNGRRTSYIFALGSTTTVQEAFPPSLGPTREASERTGDAEEVVGVPSPTVISAGLGLRAGGTASAAGRAPPFTVSPLTPASVHPRAATEMPYPAFTDSEGRETESGRRKDKTAEVVAVEQALLRLPLLRAIARLQQAIFPFLVPLFMFLIFLRPPPTLLALASMLQGLLLLMQLLTMPTTSHIHHMPYSTHGTSNNSNIRKSSSHWYIKISRTAAALSVIQLLFFSLRYLFQFVPIATAMRAAWTPFEGILRLEDIGFIQYIDATTYAGSVYAQLFDNLVAMLLLLYLSRLSAATGRAPQRAPTADSDVSENSEELADDASFLRIVWRETKQILWSVAALIPRPCRRSEASSAESTENHGDYEMGMEMDLNVDISAFDNPAAPLGALLVLGGERRNESLRELMEYYSAGEQASFVDFSGLASHRIWSPSSSSSSSSSSEATFSSPAASLSREGQPSFSRWFKKRDGKSENVTTVEERAQDVSSTPEGEEALSSRYKGSFLRKWGVRRSIPSSGPEADGLAFMENEKHVGFTDKGKESPSTINSRPSELQLTEESTPTPIVTPLAHQVELIDSLTRARIANKLLQSHAGRPLLGHHVNLTIIISAFITLVLLARGHSFFTSAGGGAASCLILLVLQLLLEFTRKVARGDFRLLERGHFAVLGVPLSTPVEGTLGDVPAKSSHSPSRSSRRRKISPRTWSSFAGEWFLHSLRNTVSHLLQQVLPVVSVLIAVGVFVDDASALSAGFILLSLTALTIAISLPRWLRRGHRDPNDPNNDSDTQKLLHCGYHGTVLLRHSRESTISPGLSDVHGSPTTHTSTSNGPAQAAGEQDNRYTGEEHPEEHRSTLELVAEASLKGMALGARPGDSAGAVMAMIAPLLIISAAIIAAMQYCFQLSPFSETHNHWYSGGSPYMDWLGLQRVISGPGAGTNPGYGAMFVLLRPSFLVILFCSLGARAHALPVGRWTRESLSAMDFLSFAVAFENVDQNNILNASGASKGAKEPRAAEEDQSKGFDSGGNSTWSLGQNYVELHRIRDEEGQIRYPTDNSAPAGTIQASKQEEPALRYQSLSASFESRIYLEGVHPLLRLLLGRAPLCPASQALLSQLSTTEILDVMDAVISLEIPVPQARGLGFRATGVAQQLSLSGGWALSELLEGGYGRGIADSASGLLPVSKSEVHVGVHKLTLVEDNDNKRLDFYRQFAFWRTSHGRQESSGGKGYHKKGGMKTERLRSRSKSSVGVKSTKDVRIDIHSPEVLGRHKSDTATLLTPSTQPQRDAISGLRISLVSTATRLVAELRSGVSLGQGVLGLLSKYRGPLLLDWLCVCLLFSALSLLNAWALLYVICMALLSLNPGSSVSGRLLKRLLPALVFLLLSLSVGMQLLATVGPPPGVWPGPPRQWGLSENARYVLGLWGAPGAMHRLLPSLFSMMATALLGRQWGIDELRTGLVWKYFVEAATMGPLFQGQPSFSTGSTVTQSNSHSTSRAKKEGESGSEEQNPPSDIQTTNNLINNAVDEEQERELQVPLKVTTEAMRRVRVAQGFRCLLKAVERELSQTIRNSTQTPAHLSIHRSASSDTHDGGSDYLSLWDTLQYVCCRQFLSVLLIIVFVFATIQPTNLIMLSYFLFSVAFLCAPERLEQGGNRLFAVLRFLNVVVIVGELAYASLPFPAPRPAADELSWVNLIGLLKMRAGPLPSSWPGCDDGQACHSPLSISGGLSTSLSLFLCGTLLAYVFASPSYRASRRAYELALWRAGLRRRRGARIETLLRRRERVAELRAAKASLLALSRLMVAVGAWERLASLNAAGKAAAVIDASSIEQPAPSETAAPGRSSPREDTGEGDGEKGQDGELGLATQVPFAKTTDNEIDFKNGWPSLPSPSATQAGELQVRLELPEMSLEIEPGGEGDTEDTVRVFWMPPVSLAPPVALPLVGLNADETGVEAQKQQEWPADPLENATLRLYLHQWIFEGEAAPLQGLQATDQGLAVRQNERGAFDRGKCVGEVPIQKGEVTLLNLPEGTYLFSFSVVGETGVTSVRSRSFGPFVKATMALASAETDMESPKTSEEEGQEQRQIESNDEEEDLTARATIDVGIEESETKIDENGEISAAGSEEDGHFDLIEQKEDDDEDENDEVERANNVDQIQEPSEAEMAAEALAEASREVKKLASSFWLVVLWMRDSLEQMLWSAVDTFEYSHPLAVQRGVLAEEEGLTGSDDVEAVDVDADGYTDPVDSTSLSAPMDIPLPTLQQHYTVVPRSTEQLQSEKISSQSDSSGMVTSRTAQSSRSDQRDIPGSRASSALIEPQISSPSAHENINTLSFESHSAESRTGAVPSSIPRNPPIADLTAESVSLHPSRSSLSANTHPPHQQFSSSGMNQNSNPTASDNNSSSYDFQQVELLKNELADSIGSNTTSERQRIRFHQKYGNSNGNSILETKLENYSDAVLRDARPFYVFQAKRERTYMGRVQPPSVSAVMSELFYFLKVTYFVCVSHTSGLVMLAIIINIMMYGSVISGLIAVFGFTYLLVAYKFPAPQVYTALKVWTLIVLTVKFALQLPIFCLNYTNKGVAYPSLYFSCYNGANSTGTESPIPPAGAENTVQPMDLFGIKIYDTLFGEGGLLYGVAGELLVLCALLLHGTYMRLHGRSRTRALMHQANDSEVHPSDENNYDFDDESDDSSHFSSGRGRKAREKDAMKGRDGGKKKQVNFVPLKSKVGDERGDTQFSHGKSSGALDNTEWGKGKGVEQRKNMVNGTVRKRTHRPSLLFSPPRFIDELDEADIPLLQSSEANIAYSDGQTRSASESKERKGEIGTPILTYSREYLTMPSKEYYSSVSRHYGGSAYRGHRAMTPQRDRPDTPESPQIEHEHRNGVGILSTFLLRQTRRISYSAFVALLNILDPHGQSFPHHGGVRSGRDLYLQSFCVLLLLLLFSFLGYSTISSRGEASFQEEVTVSQLNGVTVFLCIVIIMLALVERVAYLRRQHFLKLVTHICTTVAVHVWLFSLRSTGSDGGPNSNSNSGNALLLTYYAVWSLYLWISAYQLHLSYSSLPPRESLKYSSYIYMVYLNIPLLPEMDRLVSWVSMCTSLDLMQYFRLKTIGDQAFLVRERNRRRAQLRQGAPQPKAYKFFSGTLILIALLLVLILPALIFSTANPALEPNPVTQFEFQLSLESASSYSAFMGDNSELSATTSSSSTSTLLFVSAPAFALPAGAVPGQPNYFEQLQVNASGLRGSLKSHTQVLGSMPYAREAWGSNSPPAVEHLYEELRICANISGPEDEEGPTVGDALPGGFIGLRLLLQFTRGGPVGFEKTSTSRSRALTVQDCATLLASLDGTGALYVPSFMPYVLRLSATSAPSDIGKVRQGLLLTFADSYWNLTMPDHIGPPLPYSGNSLNGNVTGMAINVVNDQIVSNIANLLEGIGGYSIIAVYITLVLFLSRFIRGIFLQPSSDIPFLEMVDTRTIEHIIEGIRCAQSARYPKHTIHESRLWALLMALYRDPHLLVMLTRFKKND